MVSVAKKARRGFVNYPEPLEGPDVPYSNVVRNSNPAINGQMLVVSAWLMETFRFIREIAWQNTGFSKLRAIAKQIEDYEPMFEPTIVPLPGDQVSPAADKQVDLPIPETSNVRKYPEARYYSAADYRAMYLSGDLTPLDVARALLPLIRRDTTPPGEHAMAWFDTKVDMVLKAAHESTQRYLEKRSLGPLDGVPTAVKDEYDIEGYVTCLGSANDYTGSLPDEHSITSWTVRKLQEAGCVILGKLSMHEFGLDTTGNNPIYGTPTNPYNPRYYTGGSSSGSGYAVSAGLIPIALGSDGGGSIRIPSSWCGVFGLKPTHGRVSFYPGQNHCITCAVLGPMAGDVRSLATLFEVVGQPDPDSSFPRLPSASTLLSSPPPGERAKLLGIHEGWFAQADAGVQELCRSLVARLVSQHGYRLVPIAIPYLSEGQIAHAMTVLNDGATLLPPHTTGNLTAGNKILLALGRVTPATDYLLAQKLRRVLVRHLAHLWRTHPGMLIVTPTTACAGWPIRAPRGELEHGVSDGDQTMRAMEFTWLANYCGLPSISVPAGYVFPEGAGPGREGRVAGKAEAEGQKVPVGLMATGEWAAEDQLLQFGLDAEEAGADRRCRPPIWVDAMERARQAKKMGASGGDL